MLASVANLQRSGSFLLADANRFISVLALDMACGEPFEHLLGIRVKKIFVSLAVFDIRITRSDLRKQAQPC